MRVRISNEAEADLAAGFQFHESREPGLGNQFRDSLKSDIRSLEIHGGTHSKRYGFHRMLFKKFPFGIFYELESKTSLIVVAVFGQRRGEK